MPFVLDQVQQEAAELLMTNDHYCLFWDVGVGKTFPLLQRLSHFNGKKILILSPAIVNYDMWAEQQKLDYYGVFANNDVEIRSYEWMSRSVYKMVNGKRKKVKENFKELKHTEYDVLICDEAHRMSTSSYTSNSSRYVHRLAKAATYVYALTGTPARNGYQDLFHLFKNLNFDIWSEFGSYAEWLRYYFIGFELKLPTGVVFKPTKIKPYMEDSFINSLGAHCMFASKERTYKVTQRRVPVTPIVTREYVNSLNGIIDDINGDSLTVGKLVGLSKAYMILNGFEYKLNAEGVNETVEYFENPKLAPTLELVKHYHKYRDCVIIAYNYKHDYRKLSQMFDDNGIAHVASLDEANHATGKFVYLLQLKKGIGINLQHLTAILIFYTYNFSFVDYDQTIGRIDRRGQDDDVELVFLYYPKTIESDVILKALTTKKKVDQVLKNKKVVDEISKEIAEYGHIKNR